MESDTVDMEPMSGVFSIPSFVLRGCVFHGVSTS